MQNIECQDDLCGKTTYYRDGRTYYCHRHETGIVKLSEEPRGVRVEQRRRVFPVKDYTHA